MNCDSQYNRNAAAQQPQQWWCQGWCHFKSFYASPVIFHLPPYPPHALCFLNFLHQRIRNCAEVRMGCMAKTFGKACFVYINITLFFSIVCLFPLWVDLAQWAANVLTYFFSTPPSLFLDCCIPAPPLSSAYLVSVPW